MDFDVVSFLLGILFDEALRRLVIPFLRRHQAREYMVRHLVRRRRTGVAGAGASDRPSQRAASALLGSFMGELERGRLGPVDERCRRALKRHADHARARAPA